MVDLSSKTLERSSKGNSENGSEISTMQIVVTVSFGNIVIFDGSRTKTMVAPLRLILSQSGHLAQDWYSIGVPKCIIKPTPGII